MTLLDTGSQISTISVDSCNLLKLEVRPLEELMVRGELLNVVGAGGHSLKYL